MGLKWIELDQNALKKGWTSTNWCSSGEVFKMAALQFAYTTDSRF